MLSRRGSLLVLFPCIAGLVCPVIAEYRPVEATDRDAIISYVSKRFEVERDIISILNTELVAGSCFLAIRLHAINPDRSLLVYLSPDHKYLTPDLYDMSKDPLLAEHAKRMEISKQLTLSGASPERGSPQADVAIVEFSDFQCLIVGALSKLFQPS